MSSGTGLDDHLALLRRRWLPLVGCVVIGCAAALALLLLTPPVYTATTQVHVLPVGVPEPLNQVTNRQREALNLDTEAQVAQSAAVAARAARVLGGVEPEPAEVFVPPNSAVLWISVTAGDPDSAAAQSRAYAEAYLDHRRSGALSALTAQQQAVLTKYKQVNAALDQVVRELVRLTRGTPEHTLAQQRQNVLNRQSAGLALKYDALRTVAVTPGAILSRATPPDAPSAPSLPLYLGTGLMAGLLAGSAAAYARDRLDRRLRTAADVERLTGLPVLGDLSGPRPHGLLADLAGEVVSASPGKRLLVRTLPHDLQPARRRAEPLPVSLPLVLLDGSDARDLARAEAALLVVGLGRVTSTDVAAAVRRLARHDVPVIGVVTAAEAVPTFVPLLEPHPHHTLGKLVASGELDLGLPPEATPIQHFHHPQRPGMPT
ncbi:Wzz/FepE/Etk N-terminal domain-containing protein [Nonomuraea aridisoli]|uniref:Polysaccharide chain length determinant N-terminal domain-containing protein n=1 Tax=Nonomuraea aridisoli TaxID=2070368 RepID=A0A2W2E506_9ACTN|nr:Wzz/FepE/Etk N-terminal domain-containing protein [Nonomuraea aridisoli]PZG07128.1 hypothetical protein C1J01_41370 [Nonomuraea aridisoli]